MVEIKTFRFTNKRNGLTCFLSTRDLREGFNFLDEKIRKFLKGKLSEKLRHPNSYFGILGVEGARVAEFYYTLPSGFEDSRVEDGGVGNYTQWNYKVEFIAPLNRTANKRLRYYLAYANLQTVLGINNQEKLPLLTKFNVDNGRNISIREEFSGDEGLTKEVVKDFAGHLELPVKSE